MSAAARIGMITPSSNTALEPTTAALLRDRPEVTFPVTRIRVQRIGLDGSGASFDPASFVGAAELLADAKVDVIVWNGTAGSWLGVAYDRAVCEAITDATGIPATTSTLAILAACRSLGASRLGLATPYTSDVADRIVEIYAGEGITVSGRRELGLSDNFSFAEQSADTVTALLRDACAPTAEAVALVCTNVDAVRVTDQVERSTGRPVICSIAATLWWSLHLAGADPRIPGQGRLLSTVPAEAHA